MFLAGIGPPYIEWEASFWFRGEHLPEFGLYALQLPWQELDGTDVHGLVSWIITVCDVFFQMMYANKIQKVWICLTLLHLVTTFYKTNISYLLYMFFF